MHKIWTTGDKEYVVRNERDEFVLGPFTSWDVAEAARGMMDKFEEVHEQMKAINETLRTAKGEQR